MVGFSGCQERSKLRYSPLPFNLRVAGWVAVCVSRVSQLFKNRGRKAKVWREAWCRFQETQKATLELDVVTYGITISATNSEPAGSKWQHANGLVQDLKGSLEKKIDFQQVESLRFPKSDFFLWFFLG